MRRSKRLLWTTLVLTTTAFAGAAAAQERATTTFSAAAGANRSNIGATDSNAADTSATIPHAQTGAGGSSEMSATLSKSVDARKAKPGDPVTAKSDQDAKAADGTLIPHGSTLVGHVTQAKSLDKSAAASTGVDADTKLAIVFDKALLKDGREVPLNAAIQALAAVRSDEALGTGMGRADFSTVGSGAGSARGVGGGLVGGVGSSVGPGGGVAGSLGSSISHGANAALGSTVHSAGAVGGVSSSGGLTAGSQGVFGIKDLQIAFSSQGSAITSARRNVRLDSGTKMLLADLAGPSVMASGATQAAGSVGHIDDAGHASSRTTTRMTPEPRDKN